jgi:undecaprenyl-diphosphatase
LVRPIAWWLGHFVTTVIVAGMVARIHPRRWWAALELLCSAVFSGVFCSLTKWMVGRTRPYKGVEAFNLHPFRDGLWGLVSLPANVSFPSGHAALAFATAMTVSTLEPRLRWVAFSLAALVAGFRVLEGAHYVSDVAAGAALGVLAAAGARRLFRRPCDGLPSAVA